MRAFDIIGFLIIIVSMVIMIVVYTGGKDDSSPTITVEGIVKSISISENSLDDRGVLLVKSIMNNDKNNVLGVMGLYKNQLMLDFIFTARPSIVEPRRKTNAKIGPTEKDDKYEGTSDGNFIFSSTRYNDRFYLPGVKKGDKIKIVANADDISCVIRNKHNICTLEVRAYEII